MRLWNEFSENGYKFEAFIPTDSSEAAWLLKVTNETTGDVVVQREIPMLRAPIFGPDVDDVATLNQVVEEELGKL